MTKEVPISSSSVVFAAFVVKHLVHGPKARSLERGGFP